MGQHGKGIEETVEWPPIIKNSLTGVKDCCQEFTQCCADFADIEDRTPVNIFWDNLSSGQMDYCRGKYISCTSTITFMVDIVGCTILDI